MTRAPSERWTRYTSLPNVAPSAWRRGQALIEFTLFFGFMMLMLAGVTDIAFLVDAHVNVVYAARQGARVGAVLGNSPIADCAILGTVKATLLSASDVTVTRITIYRSTSTGQPNLDGVTNQVIYPGGDTCPPGTTGQGPTTPVVPSTPPIGSNNWPSLPPCPTSSATPPTYPNGCRNTTPLYEDSLGVKIDYTYQFQFNFWQAGTLNVSDYAVYPMVVQT
jgi:Flp pilus assembly protein TadG